MTHSSNTQICGNCEAANPRDGIVCSACGAVMAAYLAPEVPIVPSAYESIDVEEVTSVPSMESDPVLQTMTDQSTDSAPQTTPNADLVSTTPGDGSNDDAPSVESPGANSSSDWRKIFATRSVSVAVPYQSLFPTSNTSATARSATASAGTCPRAGSRVDGSNVPRSGPIEGGGLRSLNPLTGSGNGRGIADAGWVRDLRHRCSGIRE